MTDEQLKHVINIIIKEMHNRGNSWPEKRKRNLLVFKILVIILIVFILLAIVFGIYIFSKVNSLSNAIHNPLDRINLN